MMKEKYFEYKNYIQKQLKEINDLDERRYAREILLNSLSEIFTLTEEKYRVLEQKIRNELEVPWNYFNIFMTVVEDENYDPINSFWYPVCEEDLSEKKKQNYKTVYLKAGEEECLKFLREETIVGIEEQTGRNIAFKIRKSKRYVDQIRRMHDLFVSNHVSWQTVHMGHLERFFDLVPEEEISLDSEIIFQWKGWKKYVVQKLIPLWNIQKIMAQSQEYRYPCLDQIIYEHIYYMGDEKEIKDGYLVETCENILSIYYEKNKLILKTEKEELGNVFIYQLHQGDRGNSYGYNYPVLSNSRKENLALRYVQQAGNFIQTPMELYRKIEELSGNYTISLLDYEITTHATESILEGDMNQYTGTQLFNKDKRSILLFRFKKEEITMQDYLYESQIRFILSQMQMEFLEYRCVGALV